jgi:hypothetical protein
MFALVGSKIGSRVGPLSIRHFVHFLLLLSCSAGSYAQRTALTVSRSLDQLADEADVIVHGYVKSVTVEPHPQLTNLETILVAIAVKDTYKGTSGKTLTFRQYALDYSPGHTTKNYRKGEELVLLLRPVSEYGLTSPAGLEQGHFRVTLDDKGKRVVANGRNNTGLLHSVAARAQKKGILLSPRSVAATRRSSGPIALEDFQDLLRALAGTPR